MCGCESWTIKKAECQRIDAFKLWCWRRLLRAPWIARRSNQSILKKINPEYSLKGLLLKLKLQYFGHLIRRTDSLEQTLILVKTEGRRRKGMTANEMVGWHHRLNGHELEQIQEDGEGQGSLARCRSWGHKESDTTEWLNNWWFSSKEFISQCRRPGFDPWVGKISWRRIWQPTLVFLPGKSHG